MKTTAKPVSQWAGLSLLWKRKTWVPLLFWFLSIMVSSLSILAFSVRGNLRLPVQVSEFTLGQTSPRDVVADRDLEYVDVEASRQRVEAQQALARPVYRLQEGISGRILERFETMAGLLEAPEAVDRDTEYLWLELQSREPGLLNESQWAQLEPVLGDMDFWQSLRSLLQELLERGILRLETEGSRLPRGVEILQEHNGQSLRNIQEYQQILSLENFAEQLLDLRSEGNGLLLGQDLRGQYSLVRMILENILEENAFLDQEESSRNRERVEWETPSVVRRIHEGEFLIKKDYLVTQEALDKLLALENHSRNLNFNGLVGTLLQVFLLHLLVWLFFANFHRNQELSKGTKITLVLLLQTFVLVASLLSQYSLSRESLPYSLFLPSVLFTILVTLLTDRRLGLHFALIQSLVLLIISPGTAYPFVTSLFSSVLGASIVSNIEKRLDLIKASLVLGLFQTLLFFMAGVLINTPPWQMGLMAFWGGLNGLLTGLLGLGLLPVFEHLLNSATRFRLIELSDLNVPLLRRLLTQAPGTYSHSVNVANLAETACRAIGADYLLARVGGYYHDIGKMDQPEYFIENQKGANKHDEIRPRLSVTILKSHVKVGIEKGRELRLPRKVIDIIAQHHGKGLIEFFYSKALKEASGGQGPSVEEYSYPGPNPSFKESGVIMLADNVEAATRTIKKPSTLKLEKMIEEIIMKRFNEGLLNDSRLTFKDLEIIQKSFVQILTGQFHSRIEYPSLNRESLK